MPLAGCRDSVPAGAWGNAPTVTPLNLLKEKSQAWHLGRRQRIVPAHKLPLPQERNPPSAKKVNYGSVRCEGVKGATADFVCFHCPLVASAEAKPSATIKDCCFFRQPALIFLPIWSLPYFQRAKKTNEVRDRPLDSFGGRLPYRLNCIGRLFSYWQGRFAACALLAVPFE